jgi:hypothetical protein
MAADFINSISGLLAASPLMASAVAAIYVAGVARARGMRTVPVLLDYLLRHVVFLSAWIFTAVLVLFGLLALWSGQGEIMLAAFLYGPPMMAFGIVIGTVFLRRRLT